MSGFGGFGGRGGGTSSGFGGGGGTSSGFGGGGSAKPSFDGGNGFSGVPSGGGSSGFGGSSGGGGSGFGAAPSGGGSSGFGGASGGGSSGFGGASGGGSSGFGAAPSGGSSSGFGGASSGGGSSGFGASSGGGSSGFGFSSGSGGSGSAAAPSGGGSSGFGASSGGGSSGFGGASGGGSSGFGGASSGGGGSGFGAAPSGGGSSGFGASSGGGGSGSAAAPSGGGSSGFRASSGGGSSGFGASSGGGGSGSAAAPSGGGSSGFGASSGGGSSGFGASSGGGGSGFGAAPSGGGSSGFGGSSGGGGSGFGASSGGGSGFGADNSGGGGGSDRPRGCFNCGQDGHRSNDCTEPRKERSNNCFNCGQEGHRSNECTEPRKERSNACFNCGVEGHRGSECPEPKKERPASGACFNCGQEGHRSSDCPEPRKEKKCFNCGQEGHSSTDCPEPPNPDKKPASTHVPEDYDNDTLFAENIAKGNMFDRFFDQKVELSLGSGKKLTEQEVHKVESFAELGLAELMTSNVTKAGYNQPTPIQKYAMKNILEGKDLMACSQTGSGKTAAFLLPIMSKLMKDGDLSNVSEERCMPRVLILAPTRELAIQIHKEATKFSSGTMCKCEILYGGTSVRFQKERVQRGATIIVGTTGRIKHFIDEGIISLEQTKYLILDEADKMLEMGFHEDINAIMQGGRIAAKEVRQTLMFSATFPESVQALVKDLLKDEYLMIVVDKIGAANKCITQNFEQVERKTKKSKLLEMVGVDMDKYQANKDLEIFKQKTLIFVSSKKMADSLGVFLSESGIPTTTIHGDREQAQRELALSDFRRGKTPILIATAVAERGLDISGVDHVINFDMPKEIDEYVHRIGRTGRVGNAGKSTSFIDPEQDGQIIPPLITLLAQAEQIVPDWLNDISGGGFETGGDAGGWGGEGGGGADAGGWGGEGGASGW